MSVPVGGDSKTMSKYILREIEFGATEDEAELIGQAIAQVFADILNEDIEDHEPVVINRVDRWGAIAR